MIVRLSYGSDGGSEEAAFTMRLDWEAKERSKKPHNA